MAGTIGCGYSQLVSRQSVRYWILIILTMLAFTTRILPLSFSVYPFNNDGLTECAIAEDIQESRGLQYPSDRFYIESHSVITPAYNVLLAFLSAAVEVSPVDIAQFAIAVMSVITIVGGYIVAVRISGSVTGGLATAVTFSLLGTFVFLTGSAWKESLGVAMLILVLYSYMCRADKRMFALEILLLSLLPIVHHLVAGIVYLSIWLLTIWSLCFALMNSGIRRRHLIDLTAISLLSFAAFAYYHFSSLDRLLTFLGDGTSLLRLGVVILSLSLLFFILLRRRKHVRLSASPIMAAVILVALVWNHFSPLFPYERSSPQAVLILAIATSVIIGIGLNGIESMIKRDSRYRAIPIAFLTPILAIAAFSLLGDLELTGHWMIYRTFDFADISIALGIAASFGRSHVRSWRLTTITVCLIIALVISFPFAYMTGPLTGVRHDTQSYEVDAFDWVYGNEGSGVKIQTDERLGYIGMATNNFMKDPQLPELLVRNANLSAGWLYIVEEEWVSIGVNDYPRGHPVIDAAVLNDILTSSNVCYVGGPSDNSLIIFWASE